MTPLQALNAWFQYSCNTFVDVIIDNWLLCVVIAFTAFLGGWCFNFIRALIVGSVTNDMAPIIGAGLDTKIGTRQTYTQLHSGMGFLSEFDVAMNSDDKERAWHIAQSAPSEYKGSLISVYNMKYGK